MKNCFPTRTLLAFVAMASAAALVGCSTSTNGRPMPESAKSTVAAAPADAQCATVSAPMVTIDSRGASEPTLRIPTPPGWDRTKMLDSELIRYVMANRDLIAESFAPNVVVTLERIPGTSVTPQQVLDQQRAGLRTMGGVTQMDVKPVTVCGATAEKVNYTLPAQGKVPPHPAMVLVVAAPYGSDTWSATVTVQAINADDPTYQSDASTILDGFQMVPSGTS